MAATIDKTGLGDKIVPVNQGERSMGRIEARKFTYLDFKASGSFTTGNVIQLIDIPANSFIREVILKVTTAFNAATTNVLLVGDGTDDDGYMASGEVEETAVKVSSNRANDVAGVYSVKSAGPFYTSADTLDVRYNFTGADPTAGEAVLIAEIVTIP